MLQTYEHIHRSLHPLITSKTHLYTINKTSLYSEKAGWPKIQSTYQPKPKSRLCATQGAKARGLGVNPRQQPPCCLDCCPSPLGKTHRPHGPCNTCWSNWPCWVKGRAPFLEPPSHVYFNDSSGLLSLESHSAFSHSFFSHSFFCQSPQAPSHHCHPSQLEFQPDWFHHAMILIRPALPPQPRKSAKKKSILRQSVEKKHPQS